ncbi:hypothetical protein SAY86_016399 [Trapa natans]|uniref:J domain-containing protein n=1 Tax=Trapa natans TaxID=22666 RepID=A0AAN7QX44_TRANT|nr:hypothetical protein SAY86_016399 [Trapa natans]
MECRTTVSMKLGGSFNGTSIYDGVFSGSATFRSSSFSSSTVSSRPEDYTEIFGGSRDSRRSSIPVLDVPALHEQNASVDVRSSKLEYSTIFGGGTDDAALSFEEVIVDPRKMRNLSRQEQNQAHTRSSSDVSFSSFEDNQVLRNASHPSLDKGKKQFNVSYNKAIGGGKGGTNGMTRIAQFHDVPGYVHLLDENNPPKQVAGDKPVIDDESHPKHGAGDRVLKAKNEKSSKSSLSSSSLDKEYSKDVLRNRSPSNSSLLEGYEFGLQSEPSEVQASAGFSPNFFSSKGNSAFSDSPRKATSECGVSIGSPTYLDEEVVEANSVAAASADAVRKAIEKAQKRITIAKELMERHKDGFQANGKSGGLWEKRRVHRKSSKLREEASEEQRPNDHGKLNSTKLSCEFTDAENHARQSDDIANSMAWLGSREKRTYVQHGETLEGDEKKLSSTIPELDEIETETKPFEIMQSNDTKKPQPSDHRVTLTVRTVIESAVGTVQMIPLQKVNHKTENNWSTDEGAHERESNSDKLESSPQLQHGERGEIELEVKEEQEYTAEDLTTFNDRVDYSGKLESVHKPLTVINLDESLLEEQIMTAEECVQEENAEKHSEDREAEGNIKPSVISDGEEDCGCEMIDEEAGKDGREGESHADCGWEKNKEKTSEVHEGEGNVRSMKIPDGEKNITYEKIEGEEENRVTQGESCGREEHGGISEVTVERQENKEYNGFNLGADAKHWLDHMKEILHVRINSFFDATENIKQEESTEMEDNHTSEIEGGEGIHEEACGVEQIRELNDTRDSLDMNINARMESDEHNVPDEDKVDGSEEFTGTTTEPSGDEEDKEILDKTGDEVEDNDEDEDEDEMIEVIAEVTNLSISSAEEREASVSDPISLNEGEAGNLSTEDEDNLSQEILGSESSDLSGASLEADSERQVQEDPMDSVGFCENKLELGFCGIKFGFSHSNQYAEDPGEFCEGGKDAEGSASWKDKSHDENGAEVLSKEEEVAGNMTSQEGQNAKVSEDDRQDDNLNVKEDQVGVDYERKDGMMEISEETHTCQTTDRKEEDCSTTKMANEKETEDFLGTEMEQERETSRRTEERKEKETEREREKERLAVERAIREARERALAEARERAERAAMEKATAEARQRAMDQVRDNLGKASSETSNKPAEKTSVEARLRAERAAVERATAEARERALEKAMSDKLSGSGKDNKIRHKSSYDTQHRSSSSSSNHRSSNCSDSGVNQSSERSNGVNIESTQRSKARLERHQRTAERAAKALAEKNMRDLLAQREQAERNRLAESLDADIKRWSSGKQGNLRALLSTLQYILGTDSGWQPVPLTEIITAAAVKKAYRKATLCVHPDKLQQRGASLQQKYICEKVFDLLKEAWNRFSAEEK